MPGLTANGLKTSGIISTKAPNFILSVKSPPILKQFIHELQEQGQWPRNARPMKHLRQVIGVIVNYEMESLTLKARRKRYGLEERKTANI